MNGYYNLISPDTYDLEGFIRTGDIGYYDEDEYIYITDRCKEMLKYKSFPVSPSSIEDVLSRHPAVKHGVVIGVPHEVDGDHPIALVVLKDGVEIDPAEIKKFVDDKVDDRKRLRGGVKIIKDMPLSPTGKPDRRLLKNMVLNGGL
ncbi:luciferin 4-monooxygenase-like [Agrilus planipennis]|nr:luciferin 4-monooxygenase-like [Agrilus planipennis]XP_025834318.1 luciferin 4-monooxygenase-like [Agrilus planipennis]